TIPLFAATQQLTVQSSASGYFVDVPFGTSGQLDASSVDGGEISIANAVFIGTPAVSGSGAYRYTFHSTETTTAGATNTLNSDTITVADASAFPTGAITLKIGTATVMCTGHTANVFSGCTAHAAFVAGTTASIAFQPGQQVTVTLNAGTWSYGGVNSVFASANDTRFSASGDTYVDVTYSRVGSGVPATGVDAPTITADGFVKLDPSTLHATDIHLSGAGIGTVTVDTGNAYNPTLLADGTTVRYYLRGAFTPGAVTVSITPGWHDLQGNTGVGGGAGTFKLIDQLQQPDAPTADGPAATPNRVFFISISGSIELRAGGLFEDEANTPLLAIRGAAELQIGQRLVGTEVKTRFELTASGTVEVIKIGNLASGAAKFVLETGDGLSSIEFWGVAAFKTNFKFLEPYGIFMQGSALLEINTTSRTQTETLSLEGIPGGAIFAVSSATDQSLLASLPTDTFNPVALSADWLALFNSTGPGASTVLTLNNGRTLNFGDRAATALQNAQVEGVNPGQEWKILTGDGAQYFIQV
ncbi:MAG: hypothetical protein ACRD2I_14075, partial [Vicinamibacterales bacterium]